MAGLKSQHKKISINGPRHHPTSLHASNAVVTNLLLRLASASWLCGERSTKRQLAGAQYSSGVEKCTRLGLSEIQCSPAFVHRHLAGNLNMPFSVPRQFPCTSFPAIPCAFWFEFGGMLQVLQHEFDTSLLQGTLGRKLVTFLANDVG